MLSALDGLEAPPRHRMSDHAHRGAMPPLTRVGAAEAIDRLRGGSPVGLRHRDGYSLVAPASLASAPFVDVLEAAAGSRVQLVLQSGGLAHGRADAHLAPAFAHAGAARAAAVHDVIRHGRRPQRTASLAVVETQESGVLDGGAPEAALELVRAAGFEDGALLVPVSEARDPAPVPFELCFVCISDLAVHVARSASVVQRIVSTTLPTAYGDFEMVGYRATLQDMELVAALRGDCAGRERIPVSVHEGCLLGPALRGTACDCGARFAAGMARLGGGPRGIVIRLEVDRTSLFGHDAPPDPCRMALVVEVIRDLGPASVTLVETNAAVAAALVRDGCPVAS